MRPRGLQSGWTVLVTGASSGLGRCLVLELAGQNCGLVLTGRNRERLEEVRAEALGLGAAFAQVLVADLSAPGGAERLVEAVRSLRIPVQALVNNAGAGRAGPWADSTLGEDRLLARLLMDSPLALTKAFLPMWKREGRGALLNVASTGAFQPGPQTSVYYAAKAFMASWSLALAQEERSWLTVTTLCPGAMKTRFSESAGKRDVWGAPSPEKIARNAVRGWQRGQGLIVPGLANKLLVFVSRLAPPAWTAAGVEILQHSVKKR